MFVGKSKFLFLVLFFFLACSSPPKMAKKPDYTRPLPPGRLALERVTDPNEIPYFGFALEERDSLLLALGRSLDYFSKPSSRKYFPYLDVTHERAVATLKAFRELVATADSGPAFDESLRRNFDIYRSVGWDGKGTVLFTGYCEPIFRASLQRDSVYHYPLYRLPPDLVKAPDGTCLGRRVDDRITSFFTRKEIDGSGALDGKGLELVYLADPFEAYIVHIQGSARLILPNGEEFRIGYAGKNEWPYTSVSELLVQDGKVKREELSLRRMKEYFKRHPLEIPQYTFKNDSYVFFTQTQGGPYGCLNVPVTPYRSLATDKEVYPRGCLAFAKTFIPASTGGRRSFQAFVLDQDRGGAIKAAGRADLFMGTGPDAEELAGRTYSEGKLYYLFVKEHLVEEIE